MDIIQYIAEVGLENEDSVKILAALKGLKLFKNLKETFEKFKDCASELSDKNEMMSFVLGFKLGMRLAVEAMIGIDEITEPKMT